MSPHEPPGEPFLNSHLQAPMNYSNPSAGSFSLALIRIPSPLIGTSEYRGPILFNPGGPGGGGVEGIQGYGAQMARIVGPEFDILSFDPRGMTRTHISILISPFPDF